MNDPQDSRSLATLVSDLASQVTNLFKPRANCFAPR